MGKIMRTRYTSTSPIDKLLNQDAHQRRGTAGRAKKDLTLLLKFHTAEHSAYISASVVTPHGTLVVKSNTSSYESKHTGQ